MFSKNFVKVKDTIIGGKSNVVVQSMTNTKTADVKSTLAQIEQLNSLGSEIVRLAVKNHDDVIALKNIISKTKIPLVADIHFDYKIAIESIKAGVSKIRLNPGNIGNDEKILKVITYAKDYNVPIRVGANTGSIEKDFLKYDRWKAIAESALKEVNLLEKNNFHNIVVSAKSSDVKENFLANKYISEHVDYPLHIGVTEAGIYEDSIIQSSMGIGSLLLNGIGDTIRVSITGDPAQELEAANSILKFLGLKSGIKVVSCPTCGRTEIEIEKIVKEVKKWTKNINKNLTISVMGCVVNGPGEAKNSDIAVAGTRTGAAIYKKGEYVCLVEKSKIKDTLLNLISEI